MDQSNVFLIDEIDEFSVALSGWLYLRERMKRVEKIAYKR